MAPQLAPFLTRSHSSAPLFHALLSRVPCSLFPVAPGAVTLVTLFTARTPPLRRRCRRWSRPSSRRPRACTSCATRHSTTRQDMRDTRRQSTQPMQESCFGRPVSRGSGVSQPQNATHVQISSWMFENLFLSFYGVVYCAAARNPGTVNYLCIIVVAGAQVWAIRGFFEKKRKA